MTVNLRGHATFIDIRGHTTFINIRGDIQLINYSLNVFDYREQEAILKDLQTDITKDFEFLIAENHFEVISGKLEGVYAWIAVNYALDRFVHSPDTGKALGLLYNLMYLSE